MVCQGDEPVHVMVAMVIKACLKCPLPKISSSAPLTADLSERGLTHTRWETSQTEGLREFHNILFEDAQCEVATSNLTVCTIKH